MNAVQQRFPNWRSMMLFRSSPQNAQGNVNLAVYTGAFGQRTKVNNVTLNLSTNTIIKVSSWENDDPSNRARAVARFGHTGEILGPWGQIIALLACIVGVVLVYTGFALSWRRFFKRRATSPTPL